MVFVGGRWSSSVVGGLHRWSVACIRCLSSSSVVSHCQSSVVATRHLSSVINRRQSSVVVCRQSMSSVNVVGLLSLSVSVVGLHCQSSLSVVHCRHRSSSVIDDGGRWSSSRWWSLVEALVILIMPRAAASCALHTRPVSEHELHRAQLAHGMCKTLRTTAVSDHADFHLCQTWPGALHMRPMRTTPECVE